MSEPIRANHNSKFYTRFLLMGVAALGVMGWFLYDGLYNWPLLAERYRVYTELVESQEGSRWPEVAAERGWSEDPPEEKDNRSEETIQFQLYCAAAAAVAGVWLLGKVLLANGRWIESNGEQITTSWGQTVPYDGVVEINKRKWAKQGIAYIKYKDGDRTKRFVLDDFKFHRTPTDDILLEMEAAVGDDKITGGEPERVALAKAAEAKAEAEAAEAADDDATENDE